MHNTFVLCIVYIPSLSVQANTSHRENTWSSGYICNNGYSKTPCELTQSGKMFHITLILVVNLCLKCIAREEKEKKYVRTIWMGNACKFKKKCMLLKVWTYFVALNNPKIGQSGVIMHVFHILICICFIYMIRNEDKDAILHDSGHHRCVWGLRQT